MTQCPSCNVEVAAGARWCGICHVNTVDPTVGRLASPARRLAAYLCDIMIPATAFFSVLGIFGAGLASGSDVGAGLGSFVAIVLYFGYVAWALTLFSRGTTPGKYVLGMRVVKETGRSAGFGAMLVREWIGKWVSAIAFGAGFLWILLDRDRQGWHDKLGTTYVVQS